MGIGFFTVAGVNPTTTGRTAGGVLTAAAKKKLSNGHFAN